MRHCKYVRHLSLALINLSHMSQSLYFSQPCNYIFYHHLHESTKTYGDEVLLSLLAIGEFAVITLIAYIQVGASRESSTVLKYSPPQQTSQEE